MDVTDLLVKGTDALCVDPVSQEIQVRSSKHTLRKIDDNTMRTEMRQDLTKV